VGGRAQAEAGDAVVRGLTDATTLDMFPDEVHRVLGQLSTMTGRLPQLLEQFDTILARLLQGQDLAVSGGEHAGDPFAAIDRAGDALGLAGDLAEVLPSAVQDAERAIAHVTVPDRGHGPQGNGPA
jgi:hypothetical protein